MLPYQQHCHTIHTNSGRLLAGKQWIVKNCQQPDQCEAVLDYMNSLSSISPRFSQRLYLLYLIDSVLHYAVRRHLVWMKDVLLSRASPMLYLAYTCPGASIEQQQAKVLKVVDLWGEKQLFDKAVIQRLRYEINQGTTSRHPPTFDHQQPLQSSHQETTHYLTKRPPPPPPPPSRSSRPYYELPAGLMTVALKIDQPPYTPIDPNAIREKPPHHRHNPPSQDMLNAVNDFYAGLNLDHPLTSSSADAIFTLGWEENGEHRHHHRHHHRSEPSSMTSRSNSDERNYTHHKSSRSHSSSSSSHRRYPPPASPPPQDSSSSSMTMMMMMAPNGGRLGLGHDSSADVFDEFRKRSSYNFIKEVSRRDTSAGPKCYNCGKLKENWVGNIMFESTLIVEKKGDAWFGASGSVMQLVGALLNPDDAHALHTVVCTWHPQLEVCASFPVILTNQGIVSTIDIPLEDADKDSLISMALEQTLSV
ncbi:hypothetical protein [Absidia glauca]|uniref:CID domain-containing protein n=1 Tax=Absidia glauca TaxID=4829 RepID=A0A168L4Q4_ABSGL|nr:hypothetical protein [Absidia glauca]